MEIKPAGTEGIEECQDLPREVERRLVLRLLGYWRVLCDGRNFPPLADLDTAQIANMWPDCFLLDVADVAADCTFRDIGASLASTLPASPVGRRIADIPDNSLLGVAVAYIDEMLERKVPVSRGDEFVTDEGKRILYRSILLPMSDDGQTVNAVLGAVNCREVAEPQ